MTEGSRPSTSGCCQPSAPATPETIDNRYGLASVGYRVGEFASFRQAMIERLAEETPLRSLTTRESDDFSIALLEMWAYVGDILTFYQERAANEAYLRTAVHRSSILRFASFLDYRPAPGVAAETYLAFEVEKENAVEIPVGLRVQSVPEPGEQPQKFETVEALEALADWNGIQPRLREPQPLQAGETALYLDGMDTGLRPGDAILLVSEERRESPTSDRWVFRILQAVELLEEEGLTRVTWTPGLGDPGDPSTDPPGVDVEAFVLRRRAFLFGHNAPEWDVMPDVSKKTYADLAGESYETIDDVDEWPDFDLGTGASIDIDGEHQDIVVGSWIVLSAPGKLGLRSVAKVKAQTRTGFALTSKVATLTVDTDTDAAPDTTLSKDDFPLRTTSVFVQSEELTISERPMNPDSSGMPIPVRGASIETEAFAPLLHQGQAVIMTGTTPSGEAASELAVVRYCTQDGDYCYVGFESDLEHTYARRTARLLANVGRATHGETVADEVLGSGDGSVGFQNFELKKGPVTYVSDAGSPHGASNSLEVAVDGIEWGETPTLYGQGPEDRVLIASIDDEDTMSVGFGDGRTGSRLPTGSGNVIASYRTGLGTSGNVGADAIKTLLDRPRGLKGVRNPCAASGGADRETREQARENAPNTVRTFERVVSLLDFEDAAREYAGVAKAVATVEWTGIERLVRLTVAGDEGAVLDTEELSQVREYLDARRDPNRLLVVQAHEPIPIEVEASIEVDSAYDADSVKAAAEDALLDHFAFDNRKLGGAVHMSDLYEALDAVDGLTASKILVLRPEGVVIGDPPWHLRIKPREIASLSSESVRVSAGGLNA